MEKTSTRKLVLSYWYTMSASSTPILISQLPITKQNIRSRLMVRDQFLWPIPCLLLLIRHKYWDIRSGLSHSIWWSRAAHSILASTKMDSLQKTRQRKKIAVKQRSKSEHSEIIEPGRVCKLQPEKWENSVQVRNCSLWYTVIQVYYRCHLENEPWAPGNVAD